MITSKQAARIGAVIHGPEVVDCGSALRLIRYLERFGQVRAVLGGTMGRLAVIDAGLEGLIDIGQRRMPSQSVIQLQAGSDVVILLNHAKTRESGLAFGALVSSGAAAGMGNGATAARFLKPLLQIDWGGRFVSELVCGAGALGREISEHLGFDFLALRLSFKNEVGLSKSHDGSISRRIAGVLPGENISVNGTVIGRAISCDVEILALGGRIIEMKGASIKPHGIEKLPQIDIEKATIRSGDIRRTDATPVLGEQCGSGAVLIDHCAESAFEEAKGAALAITVGDDTTAIAGDILTRLGIRVVGIVDGDIDRLSHKTLMPKGSMIIRLRPGCDDIIGRRIRSAIFNGGTRAGCEHGIEGTIEAVMDIASKDAISIESF